MDNNYLFNYGNFFDEMKNGQTDPKYKKTASKYEELFGCQDGLTLNDQPFFNDYLSRFQMPFQVSLPEDLEEDFDWELLYKLIMGSFSSRYSIELDKGWKENPKGIPLVHISITVNSNKKEITKTLEELWGFQIYRLYEIYMNEQMDLAVLREDGENEKEGIENEREEKYLLYKKNMLILLREIKACKTINKMISNL